MDLKKVCIRAISGLIYCLVIVGLIFIGDYGVLALSILLAIGSSIEFARINHDLTTKNIPTMLLELAGCVCLCFSYLIYPLLIWVAIMILRGIEELYIDSDNPIRNLAHSYMCQIYIGIPMAIMTVLSFEISPLFLLAIFFMIWINDTGAYIVGCSIGRHKLFERISPKKTWEGFIGGFLFCLGASALFYFFGNHFYGLDRINANLGIWLGLGAIVAVFGTWGDLFESMMKRSLNIKDSGSIIPGHGGLLDRIDSLLFVLPVTAIYICIIMVCS